MASTTKTATVTIIKDIEVAGYGTFFAGEYLVEMPLDYNPALVTADCIVHDYACTLVKEDA